MLEIDKDVSFRTAQRTTDYVLSEDFLTEILQATREGHLQWRGYYLGGKVKQYYTSFGKDENITYTLVILTYIETKRFPGYAFWRRRYTEVIDKIYLEACYEDKRYRIDERRYPKLDPDRINFLELVKLAILQGKNSIKQNMRNKCNEIFLAHIKTEEV